MEMSRGDPKWTEWMNEWMNVIDHGIDVTNWKTTQRKVELK